ncbi:MAG: DUF4129 domain-containing protein [Gemmatimonadales bacterium]
MNQVAQDSLRAVLDSVFADPAYQWVERADPLAVLRRWFSELSRWLFELRETHPLGFRLFMAGMVVLLVAILVHAAWVLVRTIRPAPRDGEGAAPVALRRSPAWYRAEADRLAGAGRFAEAMQADFLALVLVLEGVRRVRFHPAKTPREYAQEAELAPAARVRLADLVRTLYGYAFARWPCGPAEFAAWRARLLTEQDAAPH